VRPTTDRGQRSDDAHSGRAELDRIVNHASRRATVRMNVFLSMWIPQLIVSVPAILVVGVVGVAGIVAVCHQLAMTRSAASALKAYLRSVTTCQTPGGTWLDHTPAVSSSPSL
jgi:hypothetical protein